jgi:hypothetical protein
MPKLLKLQALQDSIDWEQSEKGRVNLHNNPDVADSNAQGTLPNTDPIGLPINSDVNHQE